MKKTLLLAFFAISAAILPNLAGAAAETVHAPEPWGWFFQTGKSELGDRMIAFHNYVFIIIAAITALVLGLMAYIIVKFKARKGREASKTTHNTLLEVIWTTIPILVVVAIIVPSMKLLYYVDRVEEADMTLKVVGYQWYWGYEYPEYQVAEFESRMIPEKDLKEGQKRLLEVDQEVVLPVGKTVRVLVTGDPNGVIHSWGIPALKFKRDTIPGRTNEGWLKVDEEGVYYGQCYELCGADHAFMPVKIRVVSEQEFDEWVLKMGGKTLGPEVINYAEDSKAIDTNIAAEQAVAADKTEITEIKEGI